VTCGKHLTDPHKALLDARSQSFGQTSSKISSVALYPPVPRTWPKMLPNLLPNLEGFSGVFWGTFGGRSCRKRRHFCGARRIAPALTR
jgi:hypothetical protein